MATSQQWPNLGLPRVLGSDKPVWDDMSRGFGVIDSRVMDKTVYDPDNSGKVLTAKTADTATSVPYLEKTLVIQLNGAVGTTYNGTAQRTLNITPESIGAASVNDAGSRAMPVAIPVSAWEESIDHEDYAYQSEIPIPNIVGDAPGEPGDMITVTFDFASWNIANIAEVAPVVIAINGGAVLLAKEIPTDILYASVTVNKKVVG